MHEAGKDRVIHPRKHLDARHRSTPETRVVVRRAAAQTRAQSGGAFAKPSCVLLTLPFTCDGPSDQGERGPPSGETAC